MKREGEMGERGREGGNRSCNCPPGDTEASERGGAGEDKRGNLICFDMEGAERGEIVQGVFEVAAKGEVREGERKVGKRVGVGVRKGEVSELRGKNAFGKRNVKIAGKIKVG